MDAGKAKTIMQKLTDAMEELEAAKAAKASMMMEIRRAEREGPSEGTDKVITWLKLVSRIEEQVRAIQRDYEQTMPSVILGVIPNYYGIYRIVNRADKLLQKVMELNRTCLEISQFLEEEERTRRIESYLDKVCGHLEKEEGGKVVGIVGTEGGEKIPLLKLIKDRYHHNHRHLTNKVLFDHVIFIQLSQEHHRLENLQKDIAKSLGLDLGFSSYSDDSDTPAAIIFDFLKRKNFLLLLDDLWEEVDLKAVGIPDPYTSSRRRLRQKVVFTTRSGEVCARMNSHKTIKVDHLNQCVKEVITISTILADTSEPDIPSSSVNIQLEHGNKDSNMITELEQKKSQVIALEPEFHNKYNEESRGQSYQTTSEVEQTKSSHGSQISNFREEWLSLEVLYSDIKDATNGLSKSSEIGRGGYGSVYKGKLGGTMVAIKILDSTSKQGEKEFFQELEVLYQIRHPNLVRLTGACFEVNALVYEFLPNGSLEDCLMYSPNILTWQMWTRIIYEICSALMCLHSKFVVHGDIKLANILLDANFKSKLSDFGLCRILPEDMTSNVYLETVPKGTSGYVDPWFLETGILRPGSDLYSFGITILKLLTGMPPIGLGVKARNADENSFLQMIDPTAGSWPFELAKELLYWSLQCCYHNEKSSELLKDMSTCFEEMLTEIETLQEGRFKVAVRRKKVPEDSLETEEREEEKMKEEEKTKVEENKEEPVLIAVVLKVHMHSEAYAQEITMKILGLEGVHAVESALKASEITVKGIFDLLKLVEYIHREIGMSVDIVKVESVVKEPEEEKPKEGEKVKDEKKDDKEAEGEKVENEGRGIKVYNQGIAVGSSVDLSEFNDHHELLDDTRTLSIWNQIAAVVRAKRL